MPPPLDTATKPAATLPNFLFLPFLFSDKGKKSTVTTVSQKVAYSSDLVAFYKTLMVSTIFQHYAEAETWRAIFCQHDAIIPPLPSLHSPPSNTFPPQGLPTLRTTALMHKWKDFSVPDGVKIGFSSSKFLTREDKESIFTMDHFPLWYRRAAEHPSGSFIYSIPFEDSGNVFQYN